MKTQTCCFTGHRNIPESESHNIQKRLEEEVAKLIRQGVRYFGAGGALGFDTMAALTVLKAREAHSHIRLILVLPCKNQSAKWNESDKKTYNQILEQADKVVYTSESYHPHCMHVRNRHLVDHSSVCICCLTESKGGTKYTVDYAKKKDLRTINLADK